MIPVLLLAAHAAGIAMVGLRTEVSLVVQLLAIGSLLLSWILLSRSRWGWLPFLCLLAVAGFLNASMDLRPPAAADHISHFVGGSRLGLEGQIVSMESRSPGGYRLLTEMHRVTTQLGTAEVFGKVLLFIRQGTLQAHPGQMIRWRSTLRRPTSFGNPGEFDYPLHLAARDIYATAFVVGAEDVAVLVNQLPESSVMLEGWRHLLATRISKAVPARDAGLLQRLLLGMRGGISDQQRQLLATSGVAHLFSISGLHFGLLALLLYQMFRWLYTRSIRLPLWCPPQKILPVCLIIPLAAYLLLTGNAWATRRAFLTVAAIALLFARGRRTPPLTLLATVALCLLLASPLALFQPGFQLSFCGVVGILAWMPCWQRHLAPLAGLLRWPLSLLLTTAAACLATAPLTLWHFHLFAPAGLLTNLVAIPMVAWGAVPAGLLSMAILPISSMAADHGLLISAWLVNTALDIAGRISQWPGLAAIPCYLTTSALILMIGGLLTLLPFGRRRHHWLARLAVMATAVVAAWLVRPQVADFQVVALSVGQGDATLVTLAGGKHYLIDGGGLPGSSIDPGEQLVGPALGRMGIDRLQGVILSHNHPDHSSGLGYILQRFPVADFYHAGETTDLPPELQQALEQGGFRVHCLDEGWTTLQADEGQTLSLFVPSQSTADVNERSVAVFAAQQGDGVLLTADLGKSGLRQLLAAGLPGRVSLLKMPHHGSRHAYPGLLLERFQPSIAFVSAGRGNPYGFPHQQVIEACSRKHVHLFRTDLEGMLTFRRLGDSWQAQVGKAL